MLTFEHHVAPRLLPQIHALESATSERKEKEARAKDKVGGGR